MRERRLVQWKGHSFHGSAVLSALRSRGRRDLEGNETH